MFDDINLDHQLRLGLDALGLEQPTPVQEQVLAPALAGKDLKISAETGSGKTLAYLLPIAQRLLSEPASKNAGTLVLVIVPTRELARQVMKQARDLLQKTPLQAQAITGGADFKYQRALFRKNPEIIIGTPGRLLEHCERGSVDFADLKALVLDEADRMLDMGFRDDVLAITQQCSQDKQVFLLSATLKHSGFGVVAKEILDEPVSVAVGTVRQPHSSIAHQRILADSMEHKNKLLVGLLQQKPQRTIVFANKRVTAQRLEGLLRHHGLRCAAMHGELSTEERKLVIERFNNGKIDVICASDVAARGLDLKDVAQVVNYDLPRSGDDYLHRTGRTGRAGARGEAVSLIDANEWNLMASISRYLSLEFENRSLPGLKARYSGPKKQKSSGKAAGSKRKSPEKSGQKKDRARDKKNKGKPKSKKVENSSSSEQKGNDGFAPLMKKKSPWPD